MYKTYKLFSMNDEAELLIGEKKFEIGKIYQTSRRLKIVAEDAWPVYTTIESIFKHSFFRQTKNKFIICEVEILGAIIDLDPVLYTDKLKLIKQVSRSEILRNIRSQQVILDWVAVVGDRPIMVRRIFSSHYIRLWKKEFGVFDYYVSKFRSLFIKKEDR